MISLNVYLTAKEAQEAALESAIKDVWIAAMTQQPGFLRATLNTPFSDEDLATLEANKPAFAYEMVSFWRTEQQSASTGSPATSTRRSGRRSSSTAPTSPTPSSTATRPGACK